MTAVLVLAESSSHTPVKLRKFSHQFINNRALRKFAISLTFLVISLGRPPQLATFRPIRSDQTSDPEAAV
jgi:hypothetical protein